MDLTRLERRTDNEWWIPPRDPMRVPGVIYASEALVRDMDDKVAEQVANVAALPGIQRASYAMPDAHWGYGFPIGGVAAFDPGAQGSISPAASGRSRPASRRPTSSPCSVPSRTSCRARYPRASAAGDGCTWILPPWTRC
jgi:tRNA-splicing ligase RtcB